MGYILTSIAFKRIFSKAIKDFFQVFICLNLAIFLHIIRSSQLMIYYIQIIFLIHFFDLKNYFLKLLLTSFLRGVPDTVLFSFIFQLRLHYGPNFVKYIYICTLESLTFAGQRFLINLFCYNKAGFPPFGLNFLVIN